MERTVMANQRRKIIHGHTARRRGRCWHLFSHEPICVEEAMERLRLGYWTDAEAVDRPQGKFAETVLVTDSVAPDDAEDLGHMDQVLRRGGMAGIVADPCDSSSHTQSGDIGWLGTRHWQYRTWAFRRPGSIGRPEQLLRALGNKGAAFEKPMYALSFLTFVTLPSLRITAWGLIDAKQRRIVRLFVD